MPTVLVRGATGFLGKALLHRLREAGIAVAVLLRAGSRFREDGVGITILRSGPGGLPTVHEMPRDFVIDTAIDLAWSGVEKGRRDDPAQFDNADSACQFYDWAAQCGGRHFIGLGSQAEYGRSDGPIAESAPLRPTSRYGAAKIRTAAMLADRAARDGVRFSWLRLFSAFGPHDHPDALLPYLIRSLLGGETPALTDCRQRWDLLHVEDAADAMIALARTAAPGTFNLASGEARPLRDAVELVRDYIDPALALGFGKIATPPGGVLDREADITAICRATGWRPRLSLAAGLRKTVDWHVAATPAAAGSR